MREPLFKKPVLWESHFIAYMPKIRSLTKKNGEMLQQFWFNITPRSVYLTGPLINSLASKLKTGKTLLWNS